MKSTWPIRTVLVLLFLVSFASADITWYWWFGSSERGSVQTGGNLVAGKAAPGRYTTDVFTFTVDASAISANRGATYTETQPTQGFDWNGTNVVMFWRSSGGLTNGANYFRDDFLFGYGYIPGNPGSAQLMDSSYNYEAQGPLYWGLTHAATNIKIISFSNGEITWTSSVAQVPFHIEWSSDLSKGFTSDWSGFQLIGGTSKTMRIKVPMFYRVVSP